MCLSVCLSVHPSVTNFEPYYLWTGKTEQTEKILGHLWQKDTSKLFLFIRKMAGRARPRAEIATF